MATAFSFGLQRHQDGEDEAEGRDDFGEPLRPAGADLGRRLENLLGEHGMRGPDTGQPAGHLHRDIDQAFARGDLAAQPEGERHSRIEMRAGNRPQHGDQHDEDRAGGNGVAEKRDGDIAAGQPLGHDAGADHRCQQKTRADELGGVFARCGHAARPDISIILEVSMDWPRVNREPRPPAQAQSR
jgi:hypothetical protein